MKSQSQCGLEKCSLCNYILQHIARGLHLQDAECPHILLQTAIAEGALLLSGSGSFISGRASLINQYAMTANKLASPTLLYFIF